MKAVSYIRYQTPDWRIPAAMKAGIVIAEVSDVVEAAEDIFEHPRVRSSGRKVGGRGFDRETQ